MCGAATADTGGYLGGSRCCFSDLRSQETNSWAAVRETLLHAAKLVPSWQLLLENHEGKALAAGNHGGWFGEGLDTDARHNALHAECPYVVLAGHSLG